MILSWVGKLLSLVDYSLDFGAFFWNSCSFMANPMFPCTFSLPWKNAFCEFSFPVIRSTRSPSDMVSVTSGLAAMNNFQYICLESFLTLAIELNRAEPVLGIDNPETLLVVRPTLNLEPIDSFHLANQGLAIFRKRL